jgi:thiosulfate dehydrogenase
MSSRFACFALGVVTALLVLIGGAYVFIVTGGVSMDTASAPLPFETTVAQAVLRANLKDAANQKNPLPPLDEASMRAGARLYRDHCAICHAAPEEPGSDIAKGMFPNPPELFDKHEMVTDDPQGVTYWKITHGIRLSGMPRFQQTLSDAQRWQLTMLVANADKLSPAVRAELGSAHTSTGPTGRDKVAQ